STIMTSIRDLVTADSSVAEPQRVDGRRRDLFRISDFGFRISERAPFLRRLLPVPALALLFALICWWSLPPRHRTPFDSFSAATTALQIGGEMPQAICKAVVAAEKE